LGAHETEVVSPREIRENLGGVVPCPATNWRGMLREAIADPREVHLMGAGNELRTDDAVGLEIMSSLRSKLGSAPAPGIKLYAGSPMPERLLTKLASKGGRIIVFDAVEASGIPGEVVFRSMADTKYGFFGTHNIPLRLVPGLTARLGDVFLVGVQPASLEVGFGLTSDVEESVREIVGVVAEGVAERE